MKRILLYLLLSITCLSVQAKKFNVDRYPSSAGEVEITCVGHGTLMLRFNGTVVHVDPWSRLADYDSLPKADIILITHGHNDHLDASAIQKVCKPGTQLLCNEASLEKAGMGAILRNGESKTLNGIRVEAVPAYNVTSGRERFHAKGVGNGYVLTFGRFRIYIAGDTEPIPEMAGLKHIDVAFLPVNQPYTMTTDQFLEAVRMLKPGIVYPYHFGETNLDSIREGMKALTATRLVIYPMNLPK